MSTNYTEGPGDILRGVLRTLACGAIWLGLALLATCLIVGLSR